MKKVYIIFSLAIVWLFSGLSLEAQNPNLSVERTAAIITATSAQDWNSALVHGPTIPSHVLKEMQRERSKSGHAPLSRNNRTAACGPDTVQFTTARATGLVALNINNSTSAQAISQYFNAPQTLTVDGFDFFAYKIDQAGGITMNVTCEIYLAGPDSMPSGAALASVMVAIDTSFGGGNLDSLRKHASFTSPITISQPYVLVFGNYTTNAVGLLFNDYNAQDGQQSWLPGVDLFGTYTRPYNVNVGGVVFDADALFHPHVSYDLTADFTPDIACLDMDNTTVTFTNASSPILFDEMYNQSVFAGLNSPSTFDFGDASPTVQDTAPSHLYTTAGVYDVTRTDTLFGWSSTCIDIKTIALEGNDLVCPGNTTAPYGSLPDYTHLTTDTCVGQSVTQSPLPGTPYNMTTTVTLTLGSQSCMFDVSAPFSGIVYFEDFQGIGSAPVSVVSTVTGGPMTTYNVDGLTPNAAVAYVTDAWIAREDFISDPADTVAFSTSWYSPAGTANDWMVTPQISLPASTAQLSWDELAPDVAYPDGYEVRVSTTGNAVGDFTNLIYSNGAAEQTWTTRTISLAGYENQDIYIAFRNNSFDKFLLLIDDILVFAPPSGIDLALDSATNPLGEYYATTLSQFTGCNFDLSAVVENNSVENATNVKATCHILVDGNPSPVASIFSDVIGVLPSFGYDSITFTNTFSPTLEGDYTLVYVVSSDSTDFDPINDTTRVSCKIAPNYMARDNEVITGSLGIGGGNAMGVLGQNFTLKAPDNMEAISFYKGAGGVGDTISAVLYHTDTTTGKPTTLIASTVVDTIQVTDTLNFMTLEFPVPIPLTAGTYYIGVNEFQENIALGTATDIFTPGTTWIDWPNNPFGDWSNNEEYGGQFAVSYVLRPILQGACLLFCPDNQMTPYDTIADYSTLATWTCAGPVIQSPPSGTAFMDSVMVTLTADTFSCTFMVYHIDCELTCPENQLDNGATVLMDYTSLAMWNCPGSVTQSPVPGSALTDGMEVTLMADTFSCSFYVNTTVFSVDLVLDGSICGGDQDGSAMAVVTNGQSPFTYEWSRASVDTNFISGLLAGPISVTVTDGIGNVVVAIDTLRDDYEPLEAVILINTSECFDQLIIDTITGGLIATEYNLLWSTGSNNDTIQVDSAGEYYVTITDDNACVLIDTISSTHNGDVDPPVPLCAFNIPLYLESDGMLSMKAKDLDVAAYDNCTAPEDLRFSFSSTDINDTLRTLTCANLGAGTILTYVFDEKGLWSPCSASYMLSDTFAPTPSCASISVYLDDLGMYMLSETDSAAMVGATTEACGSFTSTFSRASFSCLDISTPADVTITYTDGSNNTSSCVSTVTVVDTLPPMAVCNEISVYVDASGNYTLTSADSQAIVNGGSDNCELMSATLSPMNFNCAGSDQVTVTYTDSYSNTSSCQTTITLLDTFAPIQDCFNSITVYLDSTGQYTLSAADSAALVGSTTDVCDGDGFTTTFSQSVFDCNDVINILTSSSRGCGGISVMVTVTDSSNNSSSCSSCVSVRDTLAPSAMCHDITVALDGSGNYTLSEADSMSLIAGAMDNCGPFTVALSQRSFNCSDLGTMNTIMITYEDNRGNTSTCHSTVTVIDQTAPVIVCENFNVLLNASGVYNLPVSFLLNGSSFDGCGGPLTASFSSTNMNVNFMTIDCSFVGPTSTDVPVYVWDESGNMASCIAGVRADDNIQPTAMCHDITVTLNMDGRYQLTPADSAAMTSGSTDNCLDFTASFSQRDFDCTDEGSHLIDITIADHDGNSDMCSATITIERPTTLHFTWVGLVSTAWDVGENWENGCVPGEFDDVLIKSSPNNPVITSGQVLKIRTLEVETGAELFCDGELTVEN